MIEVIYGFGFGLLFGIFVLMVGGLLKARKKIAMFEDEFRDVHQEFQDVWNNFNRVESYVDSRVDKLDEKLSKK